ncbi:MAG: hypothetical protein GX220_07885 [Treponema sp.]|nr:hypothetical protein [Treponema sp.]
MKKLCLTTLCLIFFSLSILAYPLPSFDGRAIVANLNTFPSGDYGKVPGFLPGDTVIVTNYATGISIEVLVLESLNTSDGVAIILSSDAAKKLRIEKGQDSYVKIQKKQILPYEKSVANLNGDETGSSMNFDPDKKPIVFLETDEIVFENLPEPVFEKFIPEPIEDIAKTEEPKIEENIIKEAPIVTLNETNEDVMNEIPEGIELIPLEEHNTVTLLEIPEEMPEVIPLDPIAEIAREDIIIEKHDTEKKLLTEELKDELILSESKEDDFDAYQKIIDDLTNSKEVFLTDEHTVDIIEQPEENEIEIARGIELINDLNESAVEENKSIDEGSKISVKEEASNAIIEPEEYKQLPEDSFVSEGPIVEMLEISAEKELEIADGVELPAETIEPTIDEIIIPEIVGIISMTNEPTVEIVKSEQDPIIFDEPLEPKEEYEIIIDEFFGETIVNTKEDEKDIELPIFDEPIIEEVLIADENIENIILEEKISHEDIPYVVELLELKEEIPAEEIPYVVELAPVIEIEEIVAIDKSKNEAKTFYENEVEINIKKFPETLASDNIEQVYKNIILSSSDEFESNMFYIQIATLSKKENIDEIVSTYGSSYPLNLIQLKNKLGYQVLIGPLTIDEYPIVLERFKTRSFKDAFIRKGK